MTEKRATIIRIVTTLTILGAALTLIGTTSKLATAQDSEPTFEPADCMFEGIDLGLTTLDGEGLGFECGYVTVPVRHEDPSGPTLRLPVAIRPATSESPRPDPLFLAQGGPGGDAFGIFTLLVPPTSIVEDRDIVIFNQRGTQYREPDLSCTETFDALPQTLVADSETADKLYEDALQKCYARLTAEGIDISAFNSLQNAADVEAIRRALGYDEYNFYGVSYGTLLGLHLMAQNPEGLRSVILDSVAPTDINFITELPRSENRLYDALFAVCDTDPACHDEYPDLEARYFALIDQLNAQPVSISIKDPDTSEAYDVVLDGTGLRSIVYQLLYISRMYAVFPKLVSELEAGDYRYLEAMMPLFAFDTSTSEGMYFSVICAEDADFDPATMDLEGLRPSIAETAREDLQSYIDSCALWPVDQLPSAIDDPVTSDIPTLLLSGAFDPITPPYFADAAAVGLTHATKILDPTASHGVAFQSTCVDDIIQEFLNDPTSTPDSSCLDEAALAVPVPPDTIVLPLLARVNSVDSNTLVQTGIGAILLLIVLSAFGVWPLVYLVRALRNAYPAYDPASRRLRWTSRILMLLFGILAAVFTIGLTGVVAGSLLNLTYATALVIPGSAAPILWLPVIMLLVAIGIVVSAVMLWLRPGSGSTAGKVYYTILTLAAIGILVLLGLQGLLLPSL